MNTKIRYIRKAPLLKIALGVVLFCVGIHGAIFNNVFYLVLSGIGVFLMLREGSEIDLNSKKYREIYSVVGIDLGKWKDLPELEYVSVFKTTENKRIQGMGATSTMKNNIYKLNLFYERNKKIEAYRTQDRNDAFEVAKHLSNVLNVEIYDATNN